MSMRIINLLKPVEIERQQRNRNRRLSRFTKLGEPSPHSPTICQPSELIGIGRMLHTFNEDLFLRDILHESVPPHETIAVELNL
ncbi:hypothetical protein ACVWZW_004035 [Bradyrhizobium sp. F1.13.4]